MSNERAGDNELTIRSATLSDVDAIHEIYIAAFPESEGPRIAELAGDLLRQPSRPDSISLLAEVAGKAAGHVAFSPVTLEGDPEWSGYILAPLAVKPEFHNAGIGSALVENGIHRLAGAAVSVLFVYGDPAYYSRFGFRAETAEPYAPPYPLEYPFGWQAKLLSNGEASVKASKLACVEALNDPTLW